ncbi:penicillin-binding protein [Heyndrickxia sporothermodurans]|uniref:peptidoglycan D,D-transpeptidase FtsI family protein n=1 Tax=Heyndrickxia sporothermodurans TaxID=46224 RepID=UPI000D3AB8E5|nr:penicillin-binding protein 2 [Heyndrickxia sporothermodurans]PTY80341.1 penicillin-binding protein [Heyndrickxia sporothermodurans]
MKKTKKKKRAFVSLRMNILFFVVFILFSLLILRLGIVQIVYGDDYKREIDRKENVTVNTSVPRGKILDRNGKIVVGNKPLNAITYTRPKNIKQEDILKVAEDLAKLIKKDTKADFKAITERDKKDFWILKHPDEAEAKVSKAEIKKLKNDNSKIYKLTLDRITEKEFNSFTKQELEVLAIYREMIGGYPLSPQVIKNKNVTAKEFAVVSENLDKLPGVDTTTDWDRYNVYKDKEGNETLGSVIGKISSSKEGLPKDLVDYYLARDYSRNDRVGKSYIEYQYEDILQGKKEKVKNVTDKVGNVLDSEVVREGKRGDDLVLSIDIDLQRKVEKIIKEKLGSARIGQPYMDRAFVTVMNPYTGEVLSMAGKQYERDKKTGKTDINDYALGNMTTSYSMGSVVKGATVLTGYQTGAISPGDVLNDRPLNFLHTKVKKSWNTSGFGPINDLYALKRSSNVYMFLTAMKLGGQQTYIPNGPLSIDKVAAIEKFRKNFAQFGLGVKTGIDLPGEQIGFGVGQIPPEAGKVLDFAIGQYDTYTPLQVVQYMSTIANGGYRVQPHIAKEIREPNSKMDEMGPVIQEIKPKVLNKVDMKDEWINRVKLGLEQVVNDPLGTGYGTIKNKKYKIAGKTGTAQALYDGPVSHNPGLMLWNVTFAGYAPYDNPEIAVSVVVPWSTTDKTHVNLEIADEVFKAYFELKEKREKDGLDKATSTKKVENIKSAKEKQSE